MQRVQEEMEKLEMMMMMMKMAMIRKNEDVSGFTQEQREPRRYLATGGPGLG